MHLMWEYRTVKLWNKAKWSEVSFCILSVHRNSSQLGKVKLKTKTVKVVLELYVIFFHFLAFVKNVESFITAAILDWNR